MQALWDWLAKRKGNTQGSSDTVRQSANISMVSMISFGAVRYGPGSGTAVVVVVVEVVVVVVGVVVFAPPLQRPVRLSHLGFPSLPVPCSGRSLSGHLLARRPPAMARRSKRLGSVFILPGQRRSTDCLRCSPYCRQRSSDSTSCCRLRRSAGAVRSSGGVWSTDKWAVRLFLC